MKNSMSNVDIRLILPDLREAADGAFIKNIYQYRDIFVLKLYQPGGGTTQLLIQPGQRIHLTEFVRKAPRVPPKFCSVLRKYLKDKRIMSLKQHELDRIVVIEVGDEESSYKLVVELFGNGNLLLLDPQDIIFVARKYKKMKDRDVMPKALYEFPPPRGIDVLTLEKGAIEGIIQDSNANIVRTLASRLNLDSLSCEEICALSKVAPKVMVPEIDGQTLADLEFGLQNFVEKLKTGVSKPNIVLDDEPSDDDDPQFIAFLPFQFELYQDLPAEIYDTFSQAMDEFFGVSESELEDSQEQEAYSREQKRLQRIIDKQNESIDKLVSKGKKLRIDGELIYSFFSDVQEVLETVTKARSEGHPWDDIISRIDEGRKKGIPSAQLIQRIIPSQGQIIVKLNETDVTLDIRLSAQDNASLAYDQAKKSESKVEGAKKQIEKTKEKLEKIVVSAAEPDTKKVPMIARKKRWYEKFRWFISSEGFLVLGGRDVKSNENLAKRQMGANDVFLHAALHGAPFTVIKVPDDPPTEQTLEEAAQFAVTFSRAWQDGQSSGDAYWVNPEQVSFSPPSGEYLPSGAVMIYGTKNYIRRMPTELGVGVLLEDKHAIPMSGPPSAIAAHTEHHVRVIPGNVKKGQLVKEIISKLKGIVPEDKAVLISQIPQEDVMRVLPTGGGEIDQ
ncbi:MAG: ribosome rescue protein RqcH [Candidatus Thorarchaeota archaeon]|jgi:predicted ribosome quality control (RQC) complex YloA/Tae2 family protein